MNRRELNNLIKEELSAAVRESAIPGHPSHIKEVEDMVKEEVPVKEGEKKAEKKKPKKKRTKWIKKKKILKK